jgi:hypothetical protein
MRILKNNYVSVPGEFWPNFDLKNMILSVFKGIFVRKNDPK